MIGWFSPTTACHCAAAAFCHASRARFVVLRLPAGSPCLVRFCLPRTPAACWFLRCPARATPPPYRFCCFVFLPSPFMHARTLPAFRSLLRGFCRSGSTYLPVPSPHTYLPFYMPFYTTFCCTHAFCRTHTLPRRLYPPPYRAARVLPAMDCSLLLPFPAFRHTCHAFIPTTHHHLPCYHHICCRHTFLPDTTTPTVLYTPPPCHHAPQERYAILGHYILPCVSLHHAITTFYLTTTTIPTQFTYLPCTFGFWTLFVPHRRLEEKATWFYLRPPLLRTYPCVPTTTHTILPLLSYIYHSYFCIDHYLGIVLG